MQNAGDEDTIRVFAIEDNVASLLDPAKIGKGCVIRTSLKRMEGHSLAAFSYLKDVMPGLNLSPCL